MIKMGLSIFLLSGVIVLYLFAPYKNINAATDDITSEVIKYIDHNWENLTRRNETIKLSNVDIKLPTSETIIYLSQKENMNKVTHIFNSILPKEKRASIKIKYLPDDIATIKDHGLLYLPHPYVVPGGRFNEMYGWDSYFIVIGLLQNNRLNLAKNMIDNLIYEVNYYGTILNANRTYCLERSQPPLLSEMILAYYEKTKDTKWLKASLPAIEKLHTYWISPPHMIEGLGLSRYYAGGKGKTPEELPIYYEKARDYYKNYNVSDYDKTLFYNAEKDELTPLFYVADRTVRESGFDITAKYGPFGAGILDYAPVDLNVLIYQMEKDLSSIYKILNDNETAANWEARANIRAKLINRYMWDDSLGYYFDYDYQAKKLRPYVYATTFYPLWAGIASKDQADMVANNLPNLLAEGGIVTSTYRPKLQWDAPFGWAPMQYFAVKGLVRYGYNELAREVAKRFVRTVNKAFKETHRVYEKYDVQNSSIRSTDKIDYGYNTNEVGFGWTNGVYLTLTDYLNSTEKK